MSKQAYINCESPQDQLARAFNNIAQALATWKHTHLTKTYRLTELNRAQDIMQILLLSNQGPDQDEFNQIFTRILLKTSADISQAIAGEQVDFFQHVASFQWMAQQLRENS